MKISKVAGITIILLMVNNTNHDSGHYVTVYIDDIRLAEIMITLVTINKQMVLENMSLLILITSVIPALKRILFPFGFS